MRIFHRLAQYQRLFQQFGNQEKTATVNELAALLFCSDRHARTLLQKFQQQGWLNWDAQVGRGKRAKIHCLKTPDELRALCLRQLLDQGDHQGAFQLAQLEPLQLHALLSPHMGGQWQADSPVLRIPYYRELESLVPLDTTGRAEQHLISTLHAGLTRFQTGDPQPKPDLAHHWHISHDGLIWQFYLRSQLRWHNGEPLSGTQLLATFEILRQHPRSQPSLDNVSAITLPHALCIQFTLKYPDYWLAHRLADLPCRLFHPETPQLGAGSFKLTEFEKHLVRLEQHEFYHLQHPYLEIIEYWIAPQLPDVMNGGNAAHPVSITIGQNEDLPLAKPVQRSTSLGFCYLAMNAKRNHLTQEQARKIIMLIQTSGLLTHLSVQRGIIIPSQEMLPGWPIPQFTEDSGVTLPNHLILLYQQPIELAAVAHELKVLLAAHGCEVEVQFCRNKHWQSASQCDQADLLMSDHLVGESREATMESWLRHDPLWQSILPDETRDWQQQSLEKIQQIEAPSERFTLLRAHYHQLMSDGLILPLFNYQYQVNAPPRIKGVMLTAYGWFDFCRAWLPPTPE
ncbi:bacterial extracellular solute-binding s, 5 Middle family protein [Yersinia ruckeri]|uniref:SgrR family transcriptional regulator n=1 Tax=Yersinia ruckeri TaxID=29486 RepID=UPI0005AD10D5|nr:SgrR family transcriptional regulator [Yersinia ruckeri]AJI96663.1 bacterial extracellular solute-binding s, 5 Middle family protein [Yersinia ruckeri]MCW6567662.1 SgrR family transcriptional regulator [Yersinia ruckeri]